MCLTLKISYLIHVLLEFYFFKRDFYNILNFLQKFIQNLGDKVFMSMDPKWIIAFEIFNCL